MEKYKAEMKTTYEDIIDELYDTYKKKNSDYGNSFAETIEEFGFIPAVARISDKVNRMKNIVKGQKMNVKDESFRDALMDTANYCIMTIMEIDKE
jgi:tRNA G37 N-methylase TrmD